MLDRFNILQLIISSVLIIYLLDNILITSESERVNRNVSIYIILIQILVLLFSALGSPDYYISAVTSRFYATLWVNYSHLYLQNSIFIEAPWPSCLGR